MTLAGGARSPQALELTPQTAALASAAEALDSADVEHWFFGGWAVDLWVGRVTRPHEDIDVLVLRREQPQVDAALTAAGWVHTPHADDVVGTNYDGDGAVLQLTFADVGDDGGLVVPVPGAPVVVSTHPVEPARRPLGHLQVRVLPLAKMLETKASPRADEAGAEKDRADVEALSTLSGDGATG